jgi:hypothetical protein
VGNCFDLGFPERSLFGAPRDKVRGPCDLCLHL